MGGDCSIVDAFMSLCIDHELKAETYYVKPQIEISEDEGFFTMAPFAADPEEEIEEYSSFERSPELEQKIEIPELL